MYWRAMPGDDVLAGLGGADQLIGGAGLDTADYSLSASGVNVNLDAGTSTGGDAQGDSHSQHRKYSGIRA